MSSNYGLWSHGLKGLFDISAAEILHPESDRARCICYVIDRFMELLRNYSEKVIFFGNIENLPEKILDYLAIEWGLPYYEDTLDHDTKVRLIEEGFKWRKVAGTVAGVEDLAVKMFGQAKVTQWNEYGGDPGYFKISTNATISGDLEQFFNLLIKKEKNARSWLEAIEKREDTNMYTYMGVHTRTRYIKNATINMRV